jgi:hypothetical protein
MESRRHFCSKQWTGLCLLACLGCGPPGGNLPTATQSNSAGAISETSSNTSSVTQVPVTQVPVTGQKLSNGSRTTPESSTIASTAIENQVPTKPTEPPLAKPTAAQLDRWKHVSFAPLQLVAYRENEESGFVSFIAPTNDGKHYVLGGTKLTLWNIESQVPEHEFIEAMTNKEERLLSFAVSPVGDWCIAGSADGLLRKFDIQERKEIASTTTAKVAIAEIAISPDGKEIATIPFASEVTIWNADTLEKKSSFKFDTREVKHSQYIAPNVLIAAGETMSSWDTSSGNKIKTYPSEKYQTAVALSPNGKELIFGANESLQRWNLTEDHADGAYRGVPFRNPAIRFSSDGTLVAVATGDAIRILDAATGQMLQVIDASDSTMSDVSWLPQKHMLLVASEVGQIRIWGRAIDCKEFGLSPLHAPMENSTVVSNNPATIAENLAIVDLRLLPKLPDAKPLSDNFNSVSYSAPVGVEEMKTFYRYILGPFKRMDTS